jgi:hypothetical protein
MKSQIIISLAIVALTSSLVHAGILEIPGPGTKLSGIGVVSGWKCDASGDITVRFNDGDLLAMVYGSERDDTYSVCGDTNNSFLAIFNWALLGDGEHLAVAYDNGVEFARSTFEVATTGEKFLSEASGQCMVPDFPSPGESTLVEWNESTQHFEMVLYEEPEEPEACVSSVEEESEPLEDDSSEANGVVWWTPGQGAGLAAIRAKPEDDYNVAWCTSQDGQVEVRLSDDTRADCVLPTYAVEADFADKWYEAIGQAVHYARILKKRPGVLLILEQTHDCRYLSRLCAALTGVRVQGQSIWVWTTGPASCRS